MGGCEKESVLHVFVARTFRLAELESRSTVVVLILFKGKSSDKGLSWYTSRAISVCETDGKVGCFI
jgi:hypothetical protein